MLISATEFNNHFGQYLDFSKKEPVIVENNGRKVGVFLSVDEYDRLCELDDAYWGAKARVGWSERQRNPTLLPWNCWTSLRSVQPTRARVGRIPFPHGRNTNCHGPNWSLMGDDNYPQGNILYSRHQLIVLIIYLHELQIYFIL
jgi:prevent-host-death family protein